MYIAETAPADTRGSLTIVYQLMINFGVLIGNIVNAIIIKTIDHDSDIIWRVTFAAQVIPARKAYTFLLSDLIFEL
jgi:MFS family permease